MPNLYKAQFSWDEFNQDFVQPNEPLTIRYAGRHISFPLSKGGVSVFWEFVIVDGALTWRDGRSVGATVYVPLPDPPEELGEEPTRAAVMLIDPKDQAIIPVGRVNIWRETLRL